MKVPVILFGILVIIALGAVVYMNYDTYSKLNDSDENKKQMRNTLIVSIVGFVMALLLVIAASVVAWKLDGVNERSKSSLSSSSISGFERSPSYSSSSSDYDVY